MPRLDAGRVVLDPFDPSMVQPSSVDVRLDRFFRLFDNHKYPVIDPAQEQPDLTHLVETEQDDAFVLHPGEFVLGSTYEQVTLPDDVAARLEGKSSLGRLGLLTHSTAGFIDPGFSGHVTLEPSNVATLPIMLWPGMKIGQPVLLPAEQPGRAPLRQRAVRLAVPGAARADGEPVARELPPHAGLTGASWRCSGGCAAAASTSGCGRCATATCCSCPRPRRCGWSTRCCGPACPTPGSPSRGGCGSGAAPPSAVRTRCRRARPRRCTCRRAGRWPTR
ncbi:hypothetical protein GCM10025868_24960 [Angustibacter aerolatus]|uniref:Uncharacterized protein n=1 Tax=Angustibacter aerolatus TaxID=1162965 RepID=A0ABQ6JKD2_9ACTN|nr:hypothetical protein GCM10025868_24960 [Angustibacter aerolatus]